MNEKETLDWLSDILPVGDDCFVLKNKESNLLITTDMLHEATDFPSGLSDYSIGWRSCAVSLSDIAAMGGEPKALVIAYGAPTFEKGKLEDFLKGAREVCRESGARIVGGDLDKHSEFTVVTTALGEADSPVMRKGARPGDLLAVSGNLGETAAGLKLFEQGKNEKANRLFRFSPKISEGQELREFATSMMDISDALARSLYQLCKLHELGFTLDYDSIPFSDEVKSLAGKREEIIEMGLYTGEDFQLLFTVPESKKFEIARMGYNIVGEVTRKDILINIDGIEKELEDRGFVH